MAGRFGAVVPAMVTPFRDDDDRSLDLDRAQEVARWLLERGTSTLVVAGTTGEGPTLSDGEKVDLWRATVGADLGADREPHAAAAGGDRQHRGGEGRRGRLQRHLRAGGPSPQRLRGVLR